MSVPFIPGVSAHAHSVPCAGLAWGCPLFNPASGYTLAAPFSRVCGNPSNQFLAVRGIDPYYSGGWQVPTFDFDDYDYFAPTDPYTSSYKTVDISADPDAEVTDEWTISWLYPDGRIPDVSISVGWGSYGGSVETSDYVASVAASAAGFYIEVPNPPFPPSYISVSVPQIQSKFKVYGPTWGTVITYPQNTFALGVAQADPYPGTDLPVPVSYEFIVINPGEYREFRAELGGAVTEDNYTTPVSVMAFRRGKFPQDFSWWGLIPLDGARIDTDPRRIDL